MSTESFPRAIIDFKNWRETLGQIHLRSELLFIESGQMAANRTEECLQLFTGDRRFRRGLFRKECERISSEFSKIEEKDSLLAMTQRLVDSQRSLSQKDASIMAVAEELILNCAISAPRVAASEGLVIPADKKCQFTVEQSDSELWIHACDPFGVFHRSNFAQSFRPAPINASKTHGHSGRGLEIIVDAVTDFYVKSNPQYGTWAAARIDLGLSNRDHEVEPKRLFLDFA